MNLNTSKFNTLTEAKKLEAAATIVASIILNEVQLKELKTVGEFKFTNDFGSFRYTKTAGSYKVAISEGKFSSFVKEIIYKERRMTNLGVTTIDVLLNAGHDVEFSLRTDGLIMKVLDN
ncbi:MAG: hypothetical protein ACRC5M_06660 [Anaeroplasmataceae bacterium]